MAALLIVAGALVHDKIKTKKEMKRRKVLDDERERRRQVQAEMNRNSKETQTAVRRNYDSEDEKEDESLPRYEDVVDNGEGSSNHGCGSSSGMQNNSDAPPEYGRRSAESRRHPGV